MNNYCYYYLDGKLYLVRIVRDISSEDFIEIQFLHDPSIIDKVKRDSWSIFENLDRFKDYLISTIDIVGEEIDFEKIIKDELKKAKFKIGDLVYILVYDSDNNRYRLKQVEIFTIEIHMKYLTLIDDLGINEAYEYTYHNCLNESEYINQLKGKPLKIEKIFRQYYFKDNSRVVKEDEIYLSKEEYISQL